MVTRILLLFLPFILIEVVFAQTLETVVTDTAEYKVFLVSESEEKKAKTQLMLHRGLIRVKTYPMLILNEEEYEKYSGIIDSVENLPGAFLADTISVTLRSGVSWNIEKGPPPEPRNFYFKVFTQKGNYDKAVLDRLKYIQMLRTDSTGNVNKHLIEKFNAYKAIFLNEEKLFEMSVELEMTDEGRTKITRKEIYFR